MTEQTAATTSKRLPYLWLVLGVGAVAALSIFPGEEIVRRLSSLPEAPTAPVLAAVALIAACSFISVYATQGTPIPSFVVSIVLGMVGHTLFQPIVANQTALAALVTGSAAIILFGGGLEMPLRSFLRLFVKIALLAIPGVLITGALLSFTLAGAGSILGYTIAPAVVVLLGAILASTDPAAIIPVVEGLGFKRREPKDIVVAESALNDVVGTLLTSAFFKLSLGGIAIAAAYRSLASVETLQFLGEQTAFGVVFGFAGYLLLSLLAGLKRRHVTRYGADQIVFLCIPIVAFVGAVAFGGSGFLAAFVAGLLFPSREHMREIEHFFYLMIDGVAKPIIFLLVGALVNFSALLAWAPVGIAAALVFMFVIRPLMVFLMLGVYALVPGSPRGLSVRELLFISFVRETGAIPAVLLVTTVASVTVPVDGLVEIGMWVILITLILAPPLTPLVARRLGVAS